MGLALSQREVLVLNKNWSAIGTCTMERAMALLCGSFTTSDGRVHPKARVLTSKDFQALTWSDWAKMEPIEGEDSLQSAKRKFKVPTIIVLSRYERLPFQKVNFSRKALYERDNYQCQYCGCKPGSENLTIDHVLPRSKGGVTSWQNTAIACQDCNRRKGNKLLSECGMKLIKEPKKPKAVLFRRNKKTAPKDWQEFLDVGYWNVELENDM